MEAQKLGSEFNKTEDFLRSFQVCGQSVAEVTKQVDEERFIIKESNGPRYVVGVREKDYEFLEGGPGVAFSEVGGLNEQIRELREVPKSLFTGLVDRAAADEPGTVQASRHQAAQGCAALRTSWHRQDSSCQVPAVPSNLNNRALASNVQAKFLKVVASAIVDKYIGESSRMIREMFGYAKDHQPCIIFMDEIDAIAGRRLSDGTSADREVQRTLMELLNHLDGFEDLGRVKMVMATNRPDVLDPALVRPGRIDRKIEIPLPNEPSRVDILKIHAKPITKRGEIDYEAVAKLGEDFNGADLRNVCTEAGMFAIRVGRDYVLHEDFMARNL